MMAVVIIVGVLATLATYGVRKYVFSSKTTEAIHMIGSIKSAEESYKSETFKYAGLPGAVNGSSHNFPLPGPVLRLKADWNNTGHLDYPAVWGPLGVVSDSPVIFRYAIEAGGAGGTLPTPDEFKSSPTGLSWGPQGTNAPGPWYVVAARADQNGDGTLSCFTSSNLSGEIFSINEDE